MNKVYNLLSFDIGVYPLSHHRIQNNMSITPRNFFLPIDNFYFLITVVMLFVSSANVCM